MPAHPHSELMMQFAQDAAETDQPWTRWQWKHPDDNTWNDHQGASPVWHTGRCYRRKPQQMITINGIIFAAPERQLPKQKTYFIPCLRSKSLFMPIWLDDPGEDHRNYLALGLIHLDQINAQLHAKALLSLTSYLSE